MGKARLEAFSDGVLAIIITIMVLELKLPHGGALADLWPLGPTFLGYLVSFLYVGIYWSNHHHLIHTVARPTGAILWANLHLLFWLSLLPFCTGWVGEHPTASWPTALYGLDLLAAALAWLVLQRAIIRGGGGKLAAAIGADYKGKLSPVLYVTGIGLSFVQPLAAEATYVLVAILWIIPDRRIEAQLAREEADD